jgi:hypothetical protein
MSLEFEIEFEILSEQLENFSIFRIRNGFFKFDHLCWQVFSKVSVEPEKVFENSNQGNRALREFQNFFHIVLLFLPVR